MSSRQFYRNKDYYRDCRRNRHHHRGDGITFGIIVIAIGIFLLLRTLGVFYFDFALTWPVVLIGIGLIIGLKSRFHNPAWWILIIIGAANLTPQFVIFGQPSTHFIWPGLFIIAGFAIITRPRRRRPPFNGNMDTITTTDNMLNMDVTFGGRKEIVTSKEFRGGMVTTTFGGTEINLMQADSSVQPMVLTFKVSFGGVELIVPSHWEIQNEINPSFGSVEDERMIRTAPAGDDKKVLILRGSCSFGSIEIKSY
ncbi:MAG TPA: DUF5668 domain-containing protein [Flavipsychrobacter sp.]|nr:DUF5668 domain-containing protein [Flavipsychrobacter sp.]